MRRCWSLVIGLCAEASCFGPFSQILHHVACAIRQGCRVCCGPSMIESAALRLSRVCFLLDSNFVALATWRGGATKLGLTMPRSIFAVVSKLKKISSSACNVVSEIPWSHCLPVFLSGHLVRDNDES